MIDIKVIGTGCPTCFLPEDMCTKTVNELQIEVRISKITDLNEMAGLGIFATPALIPNGKVVSMGKLHTPNTLWQWFAESAGIQI